jgi:hypothetical protein
MGPSNEVLHQDQQSPNGCMLPSIDVTTHNNAGGAMSLWPQHPSGNGSKIARQRGCLVTGAKNFKVSHRMFYKMSKGVFRY